MSGRYHYGAERVRAILSTKTHSEFDINKYLCSSRELGYKKLNNGNKAVEIVIHNEINPIAE